MPAISMKAPGRIYRRNRIRKGLEWGEKIDAIRAVVESCSM
jgi:hypothetical protein